MILIPAIIVLLVIGAHFALPICSAVVFAWCVDFRRSRWTSRDYAVTVLLATCGIWSTLAVPAAGLAGSVTPDSPLGEFYRRGIHAGVLALCVAPVLLMGGAALGRVREGAALVGVAGVAAFVTAPLPGWLGGFAFGLIVWHLVVLCLVVLDAGVARRAFERIGGCPTCGYSLLGLATAQCPECGTVMHCGSCGYDLAGLRPDGPCPECGVIGWHARAAGAPRD